MAKVHFTLMERLMAKTMPVTESGCWIWMGNVSPTGYGQIQQTSQRKMLLVHRVAYELFRGPIAEGLQIDHLCSVRCCINPNHLEAVTPLENTRRSIARNGGHWERKITHCPHGHTYDTKNTYINRKGKRICRACNQIRMAKRIADGYYRVKRKPQLLLLQIKHANI